MKDKPVFRLILRCAPLLIAAFHVPTKAVADFECTVTANQWHGDTSSDWFEGTNWWHCPLSIYPPFSGLTTYIGPVENFVNGASTGFTLPSSGAVLGSDFSTPSLTMVAWDGVTELTLTGGTLTTSATVGAPIPNSYQPTNPTQLATINFDGGQIAGSLNFTENSRVNIRADYTQPDGVWRGQGPGTLATAAGATFSVLDLQVRGTVLNAGAISQIEESPAVFLKVDGPTTFAGGGDVLLNGGSITRAVSTTSGDQITNDDNTIRGHGFLSISLVNRGVIRAEGGKLQINRNANFDNSEGQFEIAQDGELYLVDFLQSPSSFGNLIVESGGKLAPGSELKDVNLTGTGPLSVSGTVEVTGNLNNVAGIQFFDAPSISESFEIEGATTLTGGGDVVLTGGNIFAGTGNLPDDHLTNVDNTIRGSGNISAPITNQAIIRAEGGELRITGNQEFNNSLGTIQVANDGVLYLAGFLNHPLGIGDLSIEAGGMIRPGSSLSGGSALKNTNLVGPAPLIVPVGVLEIAGALHNPGTITFAEDSSSNKYFEIEGPTVLTGGGELVMGDAKCTIRAGTGNLNGDHFTNVDNTIRGQGTISSPLTNQGVIRAEGGTLVCSSAQFANESGLLEIASGGTFQIGSIGFSQGPSGTTLVRGLLDINQNTTIGAGRLEGNGIIDAASRTLTLGDAVVAPGTSAGALSSKGTLNFDGTLEIELGGTGRGITYDTLQHIGNVVLDGFLSVSFIDGFQATVSPSDTFLILNSVTSFTEFSTGNLLPGYSGSQGSISGGFVNVAPGTRVLTADGTGSFLLTQTSTSITLSDYQAYEPFVDLNQVTALTDNDQDGTLLVYEFLFGGDPSAADVVTPIENSETKSGSELSAIGGSLELDAASTYPVFDVVIRRNRMGITFAPEASGDLTFAEVPPYRPMQVGLPTPEGDFDRHRFIVLAPTGNAPPESGFLRLVIDFSSLPTP